MQQQQNCLLPHQTTELFSVMLQKDGIVPGYYVVPAPPTALRHETEEILWSSLLPAYFILPDWPLLLAALSVSLFIVYVEGTQISVSFKWDWK